MLTRKQHELLMFIDARLKQGGVSPSFEEMKDALDLRSKSGVHRLIGALEERRFIRRLPNRARALEVLRLPEGTRNDNVIQADFSGRRKVVGASTVELPLHGRIAAGQPIEALEDQRTLTVPADLLGSGEHYAVEVSGDSMIEAGILDGDYALVRRCEQARDGDIVVALIDGHEATLKFLRHEQGLVRLDPANREHEPQVYPAARVTIQGKLAGLLRRYH